MDTGGRGEAEEGTGPAVRRAGVRAGCCRGPLGCEPPRGGTPGPAGPGGPPCCSPACGSENGAPEPLLWSHLPGVVPQPLLLFLAPGGPWVHTPSPREGSLPLLGMGRGQQRRWEAPPTEQPWDPGVETQAGRWTHARKDREGSSHPQGQGENRNGTEHKEEMKVTTGNVRGANMPSQALSYRAAAERSGHPLVPLRQNRIRPVRVYCDWTQGQSD